MHLFRKKLYLCQKVGEDAHARHFECTKRMNMANEIEKLKVELLDPGLVALADKIVQVIEEGKQALAISINEIIKTTYWRIGQYIVEFEQQGNAKAKYGTSLLSNLAKLLWARVGRGYSHPNLNNMRKFYLMYPNFQISDKSSPIFQTSEKSDSTCQTVSDKLTWSHICELVFLCLSALCLCTCSQELCVIMFEARIPSSLKPKYQSPREPARGLLVCYLIVTMIFFKSLSALEEPTISSYFPGTTRIVLVLVSQPSNRLRGRSMFNVLASPGVRVTWL